MLSDHVAQEMAEDFMSEWAGEARNDILGVVESFDLDEDEAAQVMMWLDRARVLVIFDE